MQQAQDALRSWAQRVGRIVELEAAPHGLVNAEITAFAVGTDRGKRFILKNIAGKLNAQRIETEYALLVHLQSCGVPVAVPILSDSGQLILKDQERIYVLYPMLPVDHDTRHLGIKQVYANIGAAVAR